MATSPISVIYYSNSMQSVYRPSMQISNGQVYIEADINHLSYQSASLLMKANSQSASSTPSIASTPTLPLDRPAPPQIHEQETVTQEVYSILNRQVSKLNNPIRLLSTLIQILQKYMDGKVDSDESMPFKGLKREPSESEVVLPCRKSKWVRNISRQEAIEKYNEQKFIAFAFCEHGINFHFVTQQYPDMSPKAYRCTVEAVNNQAVNDIINFLRYECDLQVERLNRDQKRSIRTQLTKIREWLGNRDPKQLQTFYMFIYRYYDKGIKIQYQAAMNLYKTIISIIKSPFVNVMDAEDNNKEIDPQNNLLEEEQAMMMLFNKHKDYSKVSDDLGQKYGYKIYWSSHSVKEKMRGFLNAAFDKLISKVHSRSISKILTKYFSKDRRDILHSSEQNDLKIKLYSFYLERGPGHLKVIDLVNNLRDFYDLHNHKESTDLPLSEMEESKLQAFAKAETETANSGSVFSMQEKQKANFELGKFEADEITDDESLVTVKYEEA